MGGGRSGMGSAERVILHASFQTTSYNDSIVIYRHRSESAVILITTLRQSRPYRQ